MKVYATAMSSRQKYWDDENCEQVKMEMEIMLDFCLAFCKRACRTQQEQSRLISHLLKIDEVAL